jgi:hypothetical protein
MEDEWLMDCFFSDGEKPCDNVGVPCPSLK